MTHRQPPGHLSADSRRLWQSVVGDYLLEPHHFVHLRNALEQWDRAESCRRRIARDGIVVTNRFKAEVPNPMIEVERRCRDAFRAHMRELGLDSAPAESRGPAAPVNAHLGVA